MINRNTYKNSKEDIRVALYARVATDFEQETPQNQLYWFDGMLDMNKNLNLSEEHRYIDIGISGTQAKQKVELLKMIKAAENGEFDLIITRDVARFSRNTLETLSIVNSLKRFGVEVYFIYDSIWSFDNNSEVRLNIMNCIAQHESQKISERVRAGQALSRKRGVLYGNGNILGYIKEGNTYEIIPDEAETVQIIYKLYLQGYGYQRICKELIQVGRKCKNGKAIWTPSTVARILRNTTYKGILSYKNSDLHIQGNFPPIISAEDWYKVQSIREIKKIR